MAPPGEGGGERRAPAAALETLLPPLRFAARDQFEQLDRFTRLVVPAFR